MKNLFTYGTLMCSDIMLDVSGCRLLDRPALLRGYSRRSVRGQHYPALVEDRWNNVEGILYLDVPAAAWGRLDRFEGEMYERRPVEVGGDDGKTLSAETYLVKPSFIHCLEEVEWSFAGFLENGKDEFQKHYRGYRLLS